MNATLCDECFFFFDQLYHLWWLFSVVLFRELAILYQILVIAAEVLLQFITFGAFQVRLPYTTSLSTLRHISTQSQSEAWSQIFTCQIFILLCTTSAVSHCIVARRGKKYAWSSGLALGCAQLLTLCGDIAVWAALSMPALIWVPPPWLDRPRSENLVLHICMASAAHSFILFGLHSLFSSDGEVARVARQDLILTPVGPGARARNWYEEG